MIYSKSVGYALRALTRLAEQPDGERLTSDEIAEMEHLPAPYLAKTLQELARRGLLYSEKGRAGGFTLRYRAKDIRVLEVIEALDGEAATSRCLLGYEDCTRKAPCHLDRIFRPLRKIITEYLTRTTLADLAKARRSRRRKSKAKPEARSKRRSK